MSHSPSDEYYYDAPAKSDLQGCKVWIVYSTAYYFFSSKKNAKQFVAEVKLGNVYSHEIHRGDWLCGITGYKVFGEMEDLEIKKFILKGQK